ncbi:MAG: tetratricopeptide repeat protein [Myxococcota bacterium]
MIKTFIVIAQLFAPASDASEKADLAKAAFEEAETHYQIGLFAEALEDYKRAYELFEAPELLFNMAQCHFELQQYERALFFFDRYVEARPNTEYKEIIARRRSTAAARIEEARVRAEAESQQAALDAQLANEQEPAWYQEWWVWTTVGVVVAGSATAFVLLQSDDDFNPSLGELDRR